MITKIIESFPDYYISNTGLVISEYRYTITTSNNGIIKPKEVKSRILKPGLSGRGYEFVTLRKDNKDYTAYIHKLVANAFLGDKKTGLVIHHKDNNKRNNNSNNLQYVTRQKNTQEFFKSIGKRKGTIPLKEVIKISDRINNGENLYKIAQEYNVTRNDIATITRVIDFTDKN